MKPNPIPPVPRHVVALGMIAFAASIWAFVEGALVLISDLSIPLV